MGILKERIEWSRPRDPTKTRRASDLTPEEQAHARAALRFLRTRAGSTAKLAAQMSVKPRTLRWAIEKGAVTAGVALRAARVAGVALEEVLAGRWPPEGACPHCGRDG